MKNQLIISTIITATLITNFGTTVKPAHASFGDFMLGVGAAVGTRAIIDSSRRSSREQRYRAVSPEEEFFRGRQDGFNGARYDNPRNSPDFDRGFEEGLRQRQGR